MKTFNNPPILRSYHHFETTSQLILWLNISTDAIGKARVLKLMKVLTEIRVALKAPIFRSDRWLAKLDNSVVISFQAKLSEAEELCQRYVFTPKPFVWPTVTPLTTNWTSSPGTEQAIHEEAHEVNGLPLAERLSGTESRAVQRLLLAMETGAVEKVTQCTCGTWFFKKLATQRFHSDQCRIKSHKSTPEFRARRAAQARANYHANLGRNAR